jgi:hypothetical protein
LLTIPRNTCSRSSEIRAHDPAKRADIFRIYTSSWRDGIDFNLAYIGADFTTERKENFDQAYMRALFEYGYRQARNGYHWFKQPPVMDMPDGRPNLDAQR